MMKHNSALAAAIRLDRTDPGPYQVYADWLQLNGSPLGELLILLQSHDAKSLKCADEIVAALKLPTENVTYGWQLGMWSWLRFETEDSLNEDFDAAGFAREPFVSPLCAVLQRLRIGMLRWEHNYEDVPAVIAEAGRYPWASELPELHVGDIDDNIDMAHHTVGAIGQAISRAFPKLEWLTVKSSEQDYREVATFSVANLALPRLRELVIETCSMSKQRVAEVLAAKLPKLERLELWFGDAEYGADATLAELGELLNGRVFPDVRQLGLRNAMFTDQLVRALPGSAIAARLESLDVSMGTLTNDAALELAANAPAFPALETLDVDDNFLSPDVIERVQAAFDGKDVVSRRQKEPDRSIPGEVHLFVSVHE